MRFENRVAIVTGGGRGIGAATVRRFAQDGAAVVIADLDEGPARDIAAEITSGRGQALAVGCDVSDRRSVESLFEAALGAVRAGRHPRGLRGHLALQPRPGRT